MYTLFSRHATDQAHICHIMLEIQLVETHLLQLVRTLADLQELPGSNVFEGLYRTCHRPLDGQLVDDRGGADADELPERTGAKAAACILIHVDRPFDAGLPE